MAQINSVKQLVDFIKFTTGETQEAIAIKADYKREYLSDAITKNRETVFNKLNLTFSNILKNEKLKYTHGSEEIVQSIVNEPHTPLEKNGNSETGTNSADKKKSIKKDDVKTAKDLQLQVIAKMTDTNQEAVHTCNLAVSNCARLISLLEQKQSNSVELLKYRGPGINQGLFTKTNCL
jgi:hypothetical protein